MYGVMVQQSEDNKLTPTKGDTLASIAASPKCPGGTTWQAIALYNWGTADPNEVNRALVELVGCSAVDAANPDKSVLDPDLGTTKTIYIPKPWTPPTSLDVKKTHTVKLRKRLPPPAAVLTKVDPWFIPESESCDVGYRIEGVTERADKLDFDVYASNYCTATPTADDGFFKFAYAPVDVPIRQKRAFTPVTARKADTITDWKGESEATDGMLKPRAADKKRYVDVACSPYTVVLRYYKADADKDARITLKSFWPRFKKVLKSATDTDGIDGAAEGLKAKTEAAVTAARDLEKAIRKAEADVEAFVAASERAALRAHTASKAADRAATDIATAKSAVDQAKDDVAAAKAAMGNPPSVPTAPDYAIKKGTAIASTRGANTKSQTAHGSISAAVAALAVAVAAAAQAKAKGSAAKTSATAAATKAEAAKTKADDAKGAATDPKSLKDAAEAAATQAATAKTKADDLKAAATTASASADTCSSDASTAKGTADGAKTDTNDMWVGAYGAQDPCSKGQWNPTTTQIGNGATKAGTAKTKTDQTQTQSKTLQTSADTARTDAARLTDALAAAKTEALALTTAADATDDQVVYDKSLEVTWKVEKTAKLKNGQLLLLDKDGNAIFRKALKDSDLTKDTEITCKLGADDHAKYWLDKKTKLDLCLSGMPYRVQLQAHSAWDEGDGVAVVAMQTEVRLWAHKDAGTHVAPLDDSPSLRLALAPFRPEKDAPSAGSAEWYKLKLAEAGFHPGPVDTKTPADPYKTALGEFQRSFPKEEKKPFTRLTSDGAPNAETQAVLARTDVADAAHKKSVDIKTQTKATLDAADGAKAAAEKAATDADAAQADALQAFTLAGEAETLAIQAATDAAAAKLAADQAKTDAEAAAEAQSSSAQDASTRVSTAQASAGTAKTKAATAAASAAQAATKLTAAKAAAETAATKAATAKTSTSDTAAKVATAKTDADEAKKQAAAADDSVKNPVGDCDAKAATADTSAKAAKTAGDTAGTSADASKVDAGTASTSADKGKADTATFASAADQVQSSAQGGTFGTARGLAATAASNAATAEASANKAKADAQAFKLKAEKAKADAAQAKTDAGTAKTDATALAALAKSADDAAEADRAKKKQRKDDVDEVFRPVNEMFGNPAGRADYTRAQAEPLLADKTKDLIVWVDDRHYYTDGATIPAIAMDNYRGGMSIGDGRVDTDARFIPRPWIPVEAQLPLLGKAQSLDASGDPPAVTDAMRRAIGPLRVDWTFDELAPQVDNVPDAKLDVARLIAAYERAVTVKKNTAAALVAAGEAKAAAAAPVTRTTAAQTELGKLVTFAGDAVTLVAQAATDAAAAQAAADTAKDDAEAAATAAGSNASDAGSKAEKAKGSCTSAATKAATAVQSATTAAAKVGEAKTAAGAMATEAEAAKTDAATLAGKVDAVRSKIDEADVAAGVAKSAASVTGAIDKASGAADVAKKEADGAKVDTETAATSSGKCRDDAATAGTAADLVKSRADAVKVAADQAKALADSGAWAQAKDATTSTASQAGLAKTAADQAKTDVGTLKSSTDKAKPDVDKAKDDADKAKTETDKIEGEAQAADTAAESDRVTRQGGATGAAAAIDPAVAIAQGARARSYLAAILGKDGQGVEDSGKLYTNCPETHGGIRPASLADYYKAAFGLDKTGSNRPWLAIDDTTNKVVCSVTHDDLGQDEDRVFASYVGKAGVYLNPSRIAGDGYRYRAEVSFKELPSGASHPNREALLGRYVRPPSAHTAALRLWRKAAIRGYVRWMKNDVAGWDSTITALGDYYAAAHVHFIYEGPQPTTAQQFTPVGAGDTDLITEAEYKKCVDDKLKASGPYAGKSATYTAGYIWPYLDKKNWGTSPKLVDLQSYVSWLYGTIEETSWDEYSNELIHKLIEGAEKKLGRMRGHVIAEFTSTPPVVVIEYACNANPSHKFCEIANDPGGAGSLVVGTETVKYSKRTNNTVTCAAGGGCTGKYVFSSDRIIDGGILLCAIGRPLGGCWQFTPRDAFTWAHEVGHHRHFEHAQAYANSTTIAPGGKVVQHDSQANAYQAGATSTFQRAWDRWCVMSYDSDGPVHFCGKCLLRNRGWRVQGITNPGADVQDG
ncbi:MAG: hypothetical protein ABSE49_03670 [Polyangiaceae bacterium]